MTAKQKFIESHICSLISISLIVMFILFFKISTLEGHSLPFLGRKPFSLFLFSSSFWLSRLLWINLRNASIINFYETCEVTKVYVFFLWLSSFLFCFFTIFPLGFIGSPPRYLTGHILYFIGWLIIILRFSTSNNFDAKIHQFKTNGIYAICSVILLIVLMYSYPVTKQPSSWGDMLPNLIVFLIELLFLFASEKILYSLLNKNKKTQIIGVVSLIVILAIMSLTSVGKSYAQRISYNFIFFGPTILFFVISFEITIWKIFNYIKPGSRIAR